MKYLLDTNICIFIIKQKSNKVLHRLASCQPGEIAVSSITAAELYYGVEKSNAQEKNKLALNSFLIPLEIIDFNDQAALVYGTMRAALEKKGVPIGLLDNLIAAQAIANSLTLITNNSKEFRRVPGLSIEDWS